MGRRLPARHFGGELPGVAPWLAAAVLATRTERLRLGVLMTLLSRRRPWTVARQAATIDRLSGDRMIAGFGLYLMTKHQTTGDYLSPADIKEAANDLRLHGAREGFDLAFNPPPDVGGEAVFQLCERRCDLVDSVRGVRSGRVSAQD